MIERHCLLIFVLTVFPLLGQPTTNAPISLSKSKLNEQQVPGEFRHKIRALGDRLTTPGNERVTLTGVLTEYGKDAPVRITFELPNYFQLDRLDNPGGKVSFNGSKGSGSNGNLNEAEEDLMETFLEDAPETMLFSIGNLPNSLRILAHRSRLDNGPIFEDIYEVIGRSQSKSAKTIRQKHYYFNSSTHLASRVRYRIRKGSGIATTVETLREDWRKVGNQMVPAQISRFEGGQRVLLLKATSIVTTPATADGLFAGAK